MQRGARAKRFKKKAFAAGFLSFARNNWLFLALSCLIFFLHSCSPVRVAPETGQNHVIPNVPFYPQEAYQCGPASLAAVMNFNGADVGPEQISKDIYSDSAKGTLNVDMVIYPEKKGLIAEEYSGSINDLRKNIDAGYPVIVLVDYGFAVFQANHFMVVIGYNEYGIIVNSGKERAKFIPEKDFLGMWGRAQFWALVVKPKHQVNSK